MRPDCLQARLLLDVQTAIPSHASFLTNKGAMAEEDTSQLFSATD
jgi:hypothetical protein